ncbi:MAG: hypothetical protein JO356_20630 [Acidobacteria bacterium]|nr:hypothetical protein [Acidobacteriota bacterium]
MVSKCANPACSTPFLYFHQGKLFRRESAAGIEAAEGNGKKRAMRNIEFFWLCNDCADKMTLTFEEGVGIAVRPRAVTETAA